MPKLKITATPIRRRDLVPGDLFSTQGPDYWERFGRSGSIGESVYIRTENEAYGDEDDRVFKITIERQQIDAPTENEKIDELIALNKERPLLLDPINADMDSAYAEAKSLLGPNAAVWNYKGREHLIESLDELCQIGTAGAGRAHVVIATGRSWDVALAVLRTKLGVHPDEAYSHPNPAELGPVDVEKLAEDLANCPRFLEDVGLVHQRRYSDSWGNCSCPCHTTDNGALHIVACCGPGDGDMTPADGHETSVVITEVKNA